MNFDLTSLLIGTALGAAFGALGVWAVLAPKLARVHEDNAKHMKDLMRDGLDHILALNAEKQKQAQMEGAFDLEKRQIAISTLVEPIGKSLKEMEQKIETLGKTGAGLEAQLKSFADDQRNLSRHTQQLAQAMKNPVVRGKWGEMQLQRALEFAGMTENVHYQTQVTAQGEDGAQRPDFVINLPNGVQIIIDVKTPLDPYWALVEETNEDAQEKNLTVFRQSVRQHIKTLSTKNYSKNFNSPEFTVMFLPSEGLYSTAIGNDSTLLNEAAEKNIIIASPTTVMGLLRVVMYGWQQQKIADEAKSISKQASVLYARLSTFGEHLSKLGRNLDSAVGAYNKTLGSVEQMILPAMRKLKDMQHESKDMPELQAIEQSARPLTAPELSPELPDEKIIALKASNE